MQEKKKRRRLGDKESALSRILFSCLLTILVFCLSLSGLSAGHASSVTLSWNPNTEQTLAGYKVFYGTSSGSYATNVDSGKINSSTLSGLQDGKTYYFAVKAYNTALLESGFSNEVSYNTPVTTPVSYTLTASSDSNGSISPLGTVSVSLGTGQTFTMTPKTGYKVSAVEVDGANKGTLTSYTFSNVSANHTIKATFAAAVTTAAVVKPTITASCGPGGSISPSGTVSVASGGSQTFTIKPTPPSKFADVSIDGSPAGTLRSYTFSNVNANHSINVTFRKK